MPGLRLQRALGLELSVQDLLRGPTLRDISALVIPSAPTSHTDVDTLSDAEVEAMLSALMRTEGRT